MASTAASYRDSCVSARIKTGEACPYPRSNSFRRAVAQWMVDVHQISPELAAFHVSQMDLAELRRRLRLYLAVGVGVAFGARPKRPDPGKNSKGETVDQRLQPQLAIAVRSPSGGGGGGVDVSDGRPNWLLGERAFGFEVFT